MYHQYAYVCYCCSPTRKPMNIVVQNLAYPSKDSNFDPESKTQLGITSRTTKNPIIVPKHPTKTLNCFSDLLEADLSKET
ncbi:hypothetical protein Hanom_Chr04g00315741 [Helianthus anomalus]